MLILFRKQIKHYRVN